MGPHDPKSPETTPPSTPEQNPPEIANPNSPAGSADEDVEIEAEQYTDAIDPPSATRRAPNDDDDDFQAD